MKIKIKNRYGQIIDHDSTLPVPDGHGIVSNFMIMDGADDVQRAIASTRGVKVTDADPDAPARAAYLDMKARLQDAWRPQPYVKPDDVTVEAAREEYRQWLTNAWKAVGMTPVGPEPSTYPRVGGWQDRNPQRPPPDVRMDAAPNSSEQAYREMVRRQENAWKGS